MKEVPTIIIDTREQRPYEFTGYQTEVATLATGDYSIKGYETRVAVERKSKEDAYGCVGASRVRFVDCLERLSRLESAAIVIDSDLRDFSKPPAQTRIDQRMAVGSYVSWACQYRIPVFWMPFSERQEKVARAWAERVTVRFLLSFVKHKGGLSEKDSVRSR